MNKSLSWTELKTLDTLMRAMLEHAQSGQWEELEELDKQRIQLLDACQEKTEEMQTDNAEYQEFVESIRCLDNAIMNSVLSARQELLTESTGLRNQINAKNNYAKASSLGLPAFR